MSPPETVSDLASCPPKTIRRRPDPPRAGPDRIESLIERWEGLAVVASYHAETASWVFVALHDDRLGRPTGGCRMKSYPSPAAALRDAMRLAEGMTWKWAAMGFGYGGGKSVLAVPGPLEDGRRRALLTHFAKVLNGLGDGYGVGADLGTTTDDMAFLAGLTAAVAGTERGKRPPETGPFTATGVHAGIEACMAHLHGSADLSGRTVVVQGVGDVGEPLAAMLARSGARVLVADLDGSRARAVAGRWGGVAIAAGEALAAECDLYAPCAVGATLNVRTIPHLRCDAVAGAANNQLETPEDAERLRARGILYAPDYVVNGGGAMAFGLMERGIRDPAGLEERLRGIGRLLREIFREADARVVSPVAAARERARRTLEGA